MIRFSLGLTIEDIYGFSANEFMISFTWFLFWFGGCFWFIGVIGSLTELFQSKKKSTTYGKPKDQRIVNNEKSVITEEKTTNLDYGIQCFTENGERVKSVAEKRIADYFKENKINYIYEKDLMGKFLFWDYKITTPDFYLTDYDLYVEFWGLVDADDDWTRRKYVKNMKKKMAIYYENNTKFISIYPRNLSNLDWIFRAKFKKVTGFELPN